MRIRAIFRWLLVVFFVLAGLNHFRDPAVYFPMMPGWVPAPGALIQFTGAAEILGGVGVAVERWRRVAGWGLVVLLIAIFPANLHMALDHVPLRGLTVPTWVLWLRLPFQGVFIAWVWWTAIAPARNQVRRA